MKREEAKEFLMDMSYKFGNMSIEYLSEAGKMREAIKVLEPEPCEDCISRCRLLFKIDKLMQTPWFNKYIDSKEAVEIVRDLCVKKESPVTPKQRLCKDCKWWKDSDGIYRRSIEAESQCPINRKEVFEGNGYCYMFEPK